EGRPRGGSAEDEERVWTGHGDLGKRQHRVAVGAGGPDRRVPDRGESDRPGQREDALRGRQRQDRLEANQDAGLRQRQRRAVLRADEVNEGDVQAQSTADAVARRSYGKLVAFLAARTRDVAAAEDELSEAFVSALADWPRNGRPSKPEAWLRRRSSRLRSPSASA